MFKEFPRTPLGEILTLIYFWVHEDKQLRVADMIGVNKNLVSRIYTFLRDLCTEELIRAPMIPFGGPVAIVQCDESKFSRKRKVIKSTHTHSIIPPELSLLLVRRKS